MRDLENRKPSPDPQGHWLQASCLFPRVRRKVGTVTHGCEVKAVGLRMNRAVRSCLVGPERTTVQRTMGVGEMSMKSRVVSLVAVVAIALTTSPTVVAAPRAPSSEPPTAVSLLESLPVKGRAPMTGYSRDQFGSAWTDVNRNGCDTRTDMLVRDLVERVMSGRCKVLSGVLYPDPYTGRKLVYVRGRSVVDIDHVVALGNAWATGAQRLSATDRTAFANDPLNLLAVDASANRQKGDGDAATWLPANKGFRCAYVARQVAVKAKYHLWVTRAEKAAIARVLTGCPRQKVPADGSLPAPAAPSGGAGIPNDATSSKKVVTYANCTAARAAGVTPIRKASTPELYAANARLDRDKDGVACE